MDDRKEIERKLRETNRSIIEMLGRGAPRDEIMKAKEVRAILELRLETPSMEDIIRKDIREMRDRLYNRYSDCRKAMDNYKADAWTFLVKVLRLQQDRKMKITTDRRTPLLNRDGYTPFYACEVELQTAISTAIIVRGKRNVPYGEMEDINIKTLDIESIEAIVYEVYSQYEDGKTDPTQKYPTGDETEENDGSSCVMKYGMM